MVIASGVKDDWEGREKGGKGRGSYGGGGIVAWGGGRKCPFFGRVAG